jgi:hypothetical protein
VQVLLRCLVENVVQRISLVGVVGLSFANLAWHRLDDSNLSVGSVALFAMMLGRNDGVFTVGRLLLRIFNGFTGLEYWLVDLRLHPLILDRCVENLIRVNVVTSRNILDRH